MLMKVRKKILDPDQHQKLMRSVLDWDPFSVQISWKNVISTFHVILLTKQASKQPTNTSNNLGGGKKT